MFRSTIKIAIASLNLLTLFNFRSVVLRLLWSHSYAYLLKVFLRARIIWWRSLLIFRNSSHPMIVFKLMLDYYVAEIV